MRVLLVLVLLLACSCASDDHSRTQTTGEESPCRTRYFEQSRFTICSLRGGTVEIVSTDKSGAPLRSFAKLEQMLGTRAAEVAFAMNAGMFDEDGKAIGLLIDHGKPLHKINRRSGGGNFGLLPNGVFLVRDSGKVEVVESSKYKPAADIRFATQSGPMLVIDGKLHPKFEPDGESRNVRNGVGISPGGTPVFVISEVPVSFGKFARLFKDQLKVRNALYFDGAVSSLWDPANGRRDAGAPLGPMVLVFRSAASAPGRGGRARS